MTTRTFGKYLLDREIARGGMARVHLARLRGLGGFEKRLVLKEIDPKLASDPRFVTLFVEEANTLVQMSHPNIVPVYELGVVDGTYFLAMEHVRGTTLDALVSEQPLEPEEVAHIGAQVAEALAYAHERFSLVHRDVTPRNVMIDAHGHARLLDFGIAARLDEDDRGDAVFGTPGYLSPEQARGERLSPASDLFGLGAVLHRAATGAHAFDATIAAARSLDAPPALPRLGAVPDELAKIIRSALDPDPARRPTSGKAMAAQLRAFLAVRKPEGVADALGQRADRLASENERVETSESEADTVTPPSSGRTQSLATSPVLEKLLATPPRAPAVSTPPVPSETAEPSTQRIPRDDPPRSVEAPSPRAPARDVAGDARPTSWAVPALLALALTGLAVWALSFARFEPPTSEVTSLPLDPSPLEIEPPDAGDDAARSLDAAASEDAFAPLDAGIASVLSVAHARETGPRRSLVDARPARDERRGSLTVQAHPWADVIVDGRVVGRTPVRALPLEAGAHDVTLRCPPLGSVVSRRIAITEGRASRLSANLQTSPPTITER